MSPWNEFCATAKKKSKTEGQAEGEERAKKRRGRKGEEKETAAPQYHGDQ